MPDGNTICRPSDGSRSRSLYQAIAGAGNPFTRQSIVTVSPSRTVKSLGLLMNDGGAVGENMCLYVLAVKISRFNC